MTCLEVVFCPRWMQNFDRGNKPNPGCILNTSLPGSSGATVYQDYYGSHYRKENGLTCNDAMETQTPRSS
jgi:hypothetical protein